MNTPVKSVFEVFNQRAATIEATLTRKENVLSFLIIRFVLMSGMVLAFAWTFLHYSP